MNVKSVTIGAPHTKTLILLHGGGSNNAGWTQRLDSGMFGEYSSLQGIKFVFPTALGGNGLWYESVKSSNCANLDDACAYVMSSITNNADALNTLVNQEAAAVSGGMANIFLGGFSQGGQMASYM